MKNNQKLLLLLSAVMMVQACAPEQRCYRDEDCESPMICSLNGSCEYVCHRDSDCGEGFVCHEHTCTIRMTPDPCADGACEKPECENNDDCDGDWECKNHKCVAPADPCADGSCEKPECDNNDDCDGGWECRNHKCVAPAEPCADGSCEKPECDNNDDCDGDWECKNHKCVAPADPCADGSCEKPECENNDDCDGDWECRNHTCVAPADPCADGSCETPECENNDDCDGDWECKDGTCVAPAKPVPSCPAGMSLIQNTYCMDRYEASRPDATESYAGRDTSKAVSVAGVMPWNIGDNNAAAEAACQAAGKRLCTPAEWEYGCHGVNDTVYAYGDEYDPVICNGLDTFGRDYFHLMPTGSFQECHNGWGVYDLNGNIWEHTAGGSGMTVRGGAFNCVDSEGNHKCSYIPQRWTPLSIGFRCCMAPVMVVPEARNIFISPERNDAENIFMDDADDKDEILLAWNDTSSDTMTDVPSAIFASADDASDLQHEMTVDAAQIIGLAPRDPQEAICLEPDVFIQQAESFWRTPETSKDAVKLLKDAKKCYPDNTDIKRALGIAYARSENFPWAVKTLSAVISEHPDDCRAHSWMSWTYIQMGMPDEAEKSYKHVQCRDDYLAGRLHLIRAYNALAQNKNQTARRELDRAYQLPELYKSDAKALKSLQNMAGMSKNPNMTWKVEVDAGYASNALSSSPTDPRLIDKKMSSPFMDADLRLMIDPWKDAFSRVIFEGQVNGQYLFAKDAKNSSYMDISFRPGIVMDWDDLKFGAYYRPEFLFVKGGDIYNKGPLLSYTSQRIELDLEYKWLYIFGGYGHRTFRQRVRTRDEMDIGAGGYHPLGYGLALTWGANYRHWFSTGDMYDLNGTNVSLALDYKIIDILFRINAAYSFDDYADSKGYFDGKNARRDNLLKGTFQVWSPAFVGIRVGAQFKAGQRWSSADDYDYTDYRGLLSIKWTGDLDFYSPDTIPDDPYSIPWNLENSESAERIRDLIQQDEDLQRSSSCLQN